MKVYLAAPYPARPTIAALAATTLSTNGHDVTAQWVHDTTPIRPDTVGPAPALTDDQVADAAYACLTDIDHADALVLITAAQVSAEGGGDRHVETGYALARSIPVIVYGAPENVFHRLPDVTVVGDLGALLDELAALDAGVELEPARVTVAADQAAELVRAANMAAYASEAAMADGILRRNRHSTAPPYKLFGPDREPADDVPCTCPGCQITKLGGAV